MKRRIFLGALAAAAALLAAPEVFAGSYLDRAAVLLDGAEREGDLLRARPTDKEIVAMVHTLAEARLAAAKKMEIPAAIVTAHPHLLLVLEHSERAAAAGADGDYKKLMTHLTSARDEARTFRSLVSELGFVVPSKVGRD